MSNLFVYRDMNMEYPNTMYAGSPGFHYPEYPYQEISAEQNTIYDSLRNAFALWGLDKSHYGSDLWNPLGEFVHPNNVVLLKPNMVIHQNMKKNGTNCLYTNVSIVRAVTDYVLIALKGTGKVIIADAPVQSCDWEVFYQTSGYKEMIEFYERNHAKVSLCDLRHYSAKYQGKIVVREEKVMPYKSVVVDLGKESAFCTLSDDQNRGLRITDYDNRIMEEHHTVGKHEYSISSIALEADVIINLPKIKTHRLAGMTGALKNMVGVNTDKDCLPHYRKKTTFDKGDQHENVYVSDIVKDCLVDYMNQYIEDKHYNLARIIRIPVVLISRVQNLFLKNGVNTGNWSGNDTIWRTVKDLNKIICYADKNGIMKNFPQRRMFCIGDMVWGGDKEGPLCPSPVKSGCLVMGENSSQFDALCASLMGYDYGKIPSVKYELENRKITIQSNDFDIDHKSLKDIRERMKGEYHPAKGWDSLVT